MARKKSVPSYLLHKASGQARVRIDGHDFYLGKFGSVDSRAAYARLISEHFGTSAEARSTAPSSAGDQFRDISIDELLLAYLRFAETYYTKDGEPTKELTCMREAMGHLRAVYPSILAREFGPLKLKAVRQHMIDVCDLSRGVINNRVSRIKRIFKWAVSEELIPPRVHEGLRSVAGLRYGRTTARETEPVKPVPDVWVDAVLPYVAPQVRAMIELQRLAGMRPEEVTMIRPCDIDMHKDIWVYTPSDHKKRWLGQTRRIPFGPKAQAILRSFFDRATDDFLFSPREAEEWRNVERRRNRKTPMTPSQAKRKPGKSPKRAKRDHYDTASYHRAVKYGIKKANRERKKHDQHASEIPHWFPYQLRHSYGTNVRREFGYEAAAVGLGHSRTDVTEVYAEQDFNRAIEVARKVG